MVKYDYVTWSDTWQWRHKSWHKLTKFEIFCCLLTISAQQMTVEVIERYGGIVHLIVRRNDYVTWSCTSHWRHNDVTKADRNWQIVLVTDYICSTDDWKGNLNVWSYRSPKSNRVWTIVAMTSQWRHQVRNYVINVKLLNWCKISVESFGNTLRGIW